MDWLSVPIGILLLLSGAIIAYRFRIIEAVRPDRTAAYLRYLRVVNSFSMKVLAAAQSSDPDTVAEEFRRFQNEAQEASTELALVGSSGVILSSQE